MEKNEVVMNPERATVIVAAQILANAAREVEWEDSPDIGENDWMTITKILEGMAPEPKGFNEAYGVLETRAKEWKEKQ
jgi:hypothetical protein